MLGKRLNHRRDEFYKKEARKKSNQAKAFANKALMETMRWCQDHFNDALVTSLENHAAAGHNYLRIKLPDQYDYDQVDSSARHWCDEQGDIFCEIVHQEELFTDDDGNTFFDNVLYLGWGENHRHTDVHQVGM